MTNKKLIRKIRRSKLFVEYDEDECLVFVKGEWNESYKKLKESENE